MKMLRRICVLTLLLTLLSIILYAYIHLDNELVNNHMLHGRAYELNINGTLEKMSTETFHKRMKINPGRHIESPTPTTREIKLVTSCAGLNVTKHVESVDSWQPVYKDILAFVFSAYFIEESKKVVIIGLKARYSSLHLCQFWYKEGTTEKFIIRETQAKVTELPEGHGSPYSAVFFECPLNSKSESAPTHVSVIIKSCSAPLNILSIHHVIKTDVIRNFTVCLSPIYGQSLEYELVEWIELNRILGAEKFLVYNYSLDMNMQQVLDFYFKKGVIDVLQWRLPEVGIKGKPIDVHYFGQVATLNDCLYRNKYKSEFIVNLDLDEYIIPRSENVKTWSGVLQKMKRVAPAYNFRNTFFKKEWDSIYTESLNKTLVEKYKLVTLQKIQHEKKIFLTGLRSKYFARTSQVSSVMIHIASGVHNMPVPTDVALVHHYRDWGTKNDPEHIKVLDRTVPLKYGDDLLRKVREAWNEITGVKTVS